MGDGAAVPKEARPAEQDVRLVEPHRTALGDVPGFVEIGTSAVGVVGDTPMRNYFDAPPPDGWSDCHGGRAGTALARSFAPRSQTARIIRVRFGRALTSTDLDHLDRLSGFMEVFVADGPPLRPGAAKQAPKTAFPRLPHANDGSDLSDSRATIATDPTRR